MIELKVAMSHTSVLINAGQCVRVKMIRAQDRNKYLG
jgi:hypothetical protein